MNERARELLEKALIKAKNKRITSKQYHKILKMNHWQKDAHNAWILRDYKTFFLYIVKDAQGQFNCSFSGDKMSRYSSYADVYNNLKLAKTSLTDFVDQYVHHLNGVVSE